LLSTKTFNKHNLLHYIGLLLTLLPIFSLQFLRYAERIQSYLLSSNAQPTCFILAVLH